VKLIILDRDGVINVDSDQYVKHPDEWLPLPGSLQAIARLSRAGWKVVVASNQSGLARGYFDVLALNAMHQKCRDLLAPLGGVIDAFFICPHGPEDACHCRKPAPGMFLEIGRRFDVNLAGVPAVGDSLRDLQASAAAGCTPWLVQTGNGAKTKLSTELPAATQFAHDLADVTDKLLAQDDTK
jgi:D-glycero-D-manno-heptose 1,7-bisphosphate phosphatase